MMDRLNIVEDPDTSVVINELSGLTINEAQVGLNQFDEKLEDVSSDDGNEDPLGNIQARSTSIANWHS
jgi:hypothetical protein